MEEPVRSKRPLEEGDETNPASNKKLKKAENVKKVAEIVLVLATMGKMRGGRKPTPAEVKMMSEAREILAEICKGFSPREIFPTDSFETVIDDLGLNRVKESKLEVKIENLSIAQRIEFTKLKMEKSEVFSEPHGTPSQANAPVSAGNFQHPSAGVRASPIPNSRTLPYQLPASEIRSGGSGVLSGRHSTASSNERAGRPQLKSDQRSNANSNVDNKVSNTPTRSIQSGLNKGPAHLTNINHHMQHRINSVQSSAIDTHNEIGKLVKKILLAQMTQHHTWTPPSRDYMNKALTCQTCKNMIKEIDTALICDACERGYHTRCLQCNIKELLGDEWREWHCAKCLAISNGKPIPPKYGRVMRNISTPKVPSSTAGVQPPVEKKMQSSNENFNQRLMTANGSSGSQNVTSESMTANGSSGSQNVSSESMKNSIRLTDTEINGAPESATGKFPSEKCQSNLAEQACESKPIKASESHKSAKSKDEEGVKLSHNGLKSECNTKGEIKEDEEVERGNLVKASESCTAVRENELSSSSMHNVEWVGDRLNEVDGKMYYRSCSINGTTYQLQDYVLFSSDGNSIMPNKLQGMWEDNSTNKKWVTVTRCFFPDDLPKGIGRPCAPESNEVYESNHETTLAAGLIHGPCEVLPPRKFFEVKQTCSPTAAIDKPKPLYLCKWFYDEKKQLFRDVTC
uniref:uncharacterized protein LOC122602179 n=1 Tax=Erigeron canadensis TaxID=72917 RepID=UPI001CB90935|nr:uncharacterized protein LOC122602179 [Erigeron canadensis]